MFVASSHWPPTMPATCALASRMYPFLLLQR
jgi:hypothetical protein